mgnify:CR=1 FL=1
MKKIGSDKPFGYSAYKKLNIGDLVSWPSLETDDDNKWYQRECHGVLTNITIEFIGGRDVYFGVVTPIKNQITCKVFLYLLKKVTI